MSFAAAALLKATLALLLALGAAAAFRRAAAATRHTILVAGQLAALTMPLLVFVVPHVNVEVTPVTLPGRAEVTRPAPLATRPPLPIAPAPAPSSRDLVTLLWMLGVLAIASKRVVSFVRASAVVHRATRFGDVLMSGDVDQPVTLGSRIILPPAARQWDEARLRAVLLHEHAHVARRDSFLAAISDAVCAVYWFHPLAWLAARQAALAREQACDDAVLAQGVAPDAYAAAILEVGRTLVRRRAAHGLAMATRSQLEVRLRAILADGRVHRATGTSRIGVVIVAIACAPLLAALTPRGNEPDLRGDAFASPFSEHIAVDTIPDVAATGRDARVIAVLQHLARRPRYSRIDFVADRARWALGRAQDGEVVTPLIASLQDADWRIRAYAAFGLAVAADRRATAALVPLLDERVWRVRAMAATALASIADPAAEGALKRALGDDAWQVRLEAVRYFAAIGGHRALFESMTDDRHMAVRLAAEEALR